MFLTLPLLLVRELCNITLSKFCLLVDDLEGPRRNLQIKPLILRQLLLNIHTSRNPLFLELNNSVHGIQHTLLPWCQSGKSQNLEGRSGINDGLSLTSACSFRQPVLQLRTDGSDVRERFDVIEELSREWKSVLSLDPRSGNEGGGDIPNVDIAGRFSWKRYARVDEVVCAYCCADRGRLAGFDDLFWREGSDEQRRTDCVIHNSASQKH